VRSGSQVHITDGQAGELGGAQPGLAGQHQQGPVTAAVRVPGRGGQQGRDLVFGEVGDQGLAVALGWDREDPLDVSGVLGVATANFYELTVARHRKHATIVTSNRTPDEWATFMNDLLLAQSAVDRLASTCYELVVEGGPWVVATPRSHVPGK
jgi:hypothetical protein